jgi:hypothetical protein
MRELRLATASLKRLLWANEVGPLGVHKGDGTLCGNLIPLAEVAAAIMLSSLFMTCAYFFLN